jgi:hypothetical protein
MEEEGGFGAGRLTGARIFLLLPGERRIKICE